jgi:hypothetical protein
MQNASNYWNATCIERVFFQLAHSVREIRTSHKFATVFCRQLAAVECEYDMLLVSNPSLSPISMVVGLFLET